MFEAVPFYCEENVWMFLESLGASSEAGGKSGDNAFAVFISNAYAHVAFHHQINCEGLEVLCWDYHVVALLRENEKWLIHDFNCDLGYPLAKNEWIKASFYPEPVDDIFSPLFKLVPRDWFIKRFVSDRSHMIGTDGFYTEPPPSWPAIGKGSPNLSRFADMNDLADGDVYTLEDFAAAKTFARGRCNHRKAPRDDVLPS